MGAWNSYRCNIVGVSVELVDVAGIRHVHLVDTCVRITRDRKQFTIRRNSEQIDGLRTSDNQDLIMACTIIHSHMQVPWHTESGYCIVRKQSPLLTSQNRMV